MMTVKDKRIIRRYLKLIRPAHIGKEMGLSRERIKQVIHKHFTEEERKFVKEMVKRKEIEIKYINELKKYVSRIQN